MKTIKFYTVGCKVNQYDTQNIREQFIRAGFKELDNNRPADIYIINTCTVTHRADSESLNLIRHARRENPCGFIIVTGCLTELDSDRIKETGGIDLIVRNKEKGRIFEHLVLLNRQTGKPANRQTKEGISYFAGHTRAFLKIQDGCSNFCSYCKVPLVRGRSRSRPLNEIIQEAITLVKNGFKEIVLCGICLGSYGKDLNPEINLVNVIEALENIEGLLRIRLSSVEAADISDALIDKMAQSKRICSHLHIPLQSGDDKILKKMNRHYTRADYLNLIKKIKAKIPLIAITTDVLTGFPEENEENFQNTVEAVEEILPLKVHIFPYSQRKGTAAANLENKLSPKILRSRIAHLKKIAQACSLKYKSHFLNKKTDVLIEGESKESPDFWQGYTDNYIKVLVNSDKNLQNELMPVRLKKILGGYMLADSC